MLADQATSTTTTSVSKLLKTIDWSKTAIGPRSTWPACLRTAVDILASSQAQIVLFWGAEFTAFYNDAYAPTIGNKHPHAFGRPAREFWGELWGDLRPLLAGVFETGKTVAAKDRPFYIERHGFPETVYFDISYSPVNDVNDVVRGVFCIVNETTDRVRKDIALRDSEERLRAIFSQSAAGIGLGDLSGKLISVNQRFCEIAGRTSEELMGMCMHDITYVDDLAENSQLFERMTKTGESFDIEKRYVRPDGSHVWVANSVSAIKDDKGTIVQAVAIVVDITERKNVQRFESHLASMIASSNDAILGIDLDMRITSWNAAAERLYGYAESEAIGRSVLMLVPEERQDEEPVILNSVKAGRMVEPYETQRVCKNGHIVDVLLSVSPIHDASGRVIGASKLAHNISARKETERLQSILTNELHHRVKNILATVIAVARQTLGRDQANKESIDAFTNRVMSLSRAQDLLVHGDWQGSDLRSVVMQAISPYPTDVFEIDGPRVSLPQNAVISLSLALHELATNAAKYGALSVGSGRISIAWRYDIASSKLHIVWKERGGPIVDSPEHKGFGSTLVERLLSAELNGTAEICFDADGVRCEINADLFER